MQVHTNRSRPRSSNPDITPDGILVLDGYGLAVSVERGHLTYRDGFGRQRRTGRVSRAAGRLKRLVVIGHSGFVTFEALRWLHGVGASFIHLDTDGTLFQVSARRGLDDARLRRAQAIAGGTERGIGIARDLIRHKLEGQARVLRELGSAGEVVESAFAIWPARLDAAASEKEIRLVEARAAAVYWSVWSDLPLRFRSQDVPDHWRTFGARGSLLTGSPRKATNPANAILNYLYALLEAECTIACHVMGLDPGFGFLHADLAARASLSMDLMEAARPRLDEQVLDVLRSWTFEPKEFAETADGQCRLTAPLARSLATLCGDASDWIGPHAEAIAQSLVGPSRRLPTRLTESNRADGRAAMKGGVARRQ